MKMRSIAIVTAVVMGTVGMLSAETRRPSEADLGAASGPGVVAPRPISPSISGPAMMQGGGMPMATGMQRMPNYGPGYQTPMTPGQQAAMQIGGGVIEVGKQWSDLGAKVVGGREETQQKLTLLHEQSAADNAKLVAAAAAEKTKLEAATAADNAKLVAAAAAQDKKFEQQKQIKTSIDAAIDPTASRVSTLLTKKQVDVDTLSGLIEMAQEKNIQNLEGYNTKLETANKLLQQADDKIVEATTKRSEITNTALDKMSLCDTSQVISLFGSAERLLNQIKLDSSISILKMKMNVKK